MPRTTVMVLGCPAASDGASGRATPVSFAAVGTHALTAPLQGTVISVLVGPGDAVPAGASVVIIESMKMEHVVSATVSGTVATVAVAVGDTVVPGDVLIAIEEGVVDSPAVPHDANAGSTTRPELVELAQ